MHELQGKDMMLPLENMSKGFKGRLYDEIGKKANRGTYQTFIRNTGGLSHLLLLSFN